MGVSRVFERSLTGDFLGCFKEVERVFQWSFKCVSRVFKRSSILKIYPVNFILEFKRFTEFGIYTVNHRK